LTGTVSGGIDTVTLSTASGDVVANAQDSLLYLASGWTGSEYNIVGDCCGSEVYFNSGSSLTVRLAAANGTTNPPTCAVPFSFNGETAETNNLNLTSACSPVGGTSPAIVFTESGGGQVPPGVSIGDTHLTKFHGLHYDFQATGDSVLVQSDPDFVVQSRQRPFTPPAASVLINATPDESATVLIGPVFTPACSRLSRNSTPNVSLPSFPRMVTAAPRRAAATAWFAPFPPEKVRNVDPATVSPARGMWLEEATKSRLILPTTTISFRMIADLTYKRGATAIASQSDQETVTPHRKPARMTPVT
jgi:hypothetical protein